MSEVDALHTALWILGGLFAVIAYFLRQKDHQQAEQIKLLTEQVLTQTKLLSQHAELLKQQAEQIGLLFTKHDQDAQRLYDLELKIAETHYTKSELNDVLGRLENKVDKLIDFMAKGAAK